MAKHGHNHTAFNAHSKGTLSPIHKGYKHVHVYNVHRAPMCPYTYVALPLPCLPKLAPRQKTPPPPSGGLEKGAHTPPSWCTFPPAMGQTWRKIAFNHSLGHPKWSRNNLGKNYF